MLVLFWEVQITIAEFCEGMTLHSAQKLSSAHIQAIVELTGSDKGSTSINSPELVSLLQVQIIKRCFGSVGYGIMWYDALHT